MRTSPKPSTSTPSTPITSLPSKIRSRLTRLAEQKLQIQDQLDDLELIKRAVLDELLELSTTHHLDKVEGNGWRLSPPQTRTTRTLSEMKLLDNGVPLKVIQACTEEKEGKPFIKVERVKEKVK